MENRRFVIYLEEFWSSPSQAYQQDVCFYCMHIGIGKGTSSLQADDTCKINIKLEIKFGSLKNSSLGAVVNLSQIQQNICPT